MPLARLENLLKNLNGNILYVDPAQLDSTDSIENRGNSALRPFKTIQRALLEAVRFSYIPGTNNDLFDQTTILISPGTHYIDNRPGYYVDGSTIKNSSGSTSNLSELSLQSNFDLSDSNNELYKYNSADGGVIIPRGVSIVANDLRKTKIRPKYIPSPTQTSVGRSSIFKLTGSCYIYGFSIYDGDPNGNVYYLPNSTTQIPPRYSHHKLTAFEYVDGKNKYVRNGATLDKTDLEMYYFKVAKGFGPNSGYPVIPDWSTNPDLYPNLDENKIVGDLGFGSIPISDLYAGDGETEITNIVTVTTEQEHNLNPNTSILISNVGGTIQEISEYNGSFTVAQVISPYQFTYRLSDAPDSTLTPTLNPNNQLSNIRIASDTVSSSSPYVFNCSLKSVYGMNGLHADGSKATGFKSIVTAQFTGISLQKDDNAFVLYNENTGVYNDQNSFSNEFLHQNSRSVYKPDWESFHIKASNDAFIQCVSIFAIGYAKQFVADNGGDQSITNSNSNFGSIALSSRGFKDYQLDKDNYGFITHIIPPKDIPNSESEIRCFKLDSTKTSTVNNPSRLYLKDYDNELEVPLGTIRDFTIGGRDGDKLYISSVSYGATILPNYKLDVEISDIDTITNTITLSEPITINTATGFTESQPVKIVAKNGILPDGIEPHKIYYVHKSLTTTTVQLSENETLSKLDGDENIIDIKNTIGLGSGNLKLVSKVSDRSPGQANSPIQFDSTNNGWYINIQSDSQFLNAVSNSTDPIFSIRRIVDNRSLEDKLYRARYVIPKEFLNAAEPSVGFVLQRSSSDISTNYTTGNGVITGLEDVRNTNQIVDSWVTPGNPNVATIVTKTPHNLQPNNKINIYNLKSSNELNPVGLGTGTGYNGSFVVNSVVNDLQFTYVIDRDPGTISGVPSASTTWMNTRNCSSPTYRVPPYTVNGDTSVRNNLPYFSCESTNSDIQLYKINTIQKYSAGVSDGIYYLTLNSFKNIPYSSPFNVDDLKLSQSIENLYPSLDLDNVLSDPPASKTVASRKIIGKVDINDLENSVSKETTLDFFKNYGVGLEILSITKSGSTCTITTVNNHGLGGIREFTPISPTGSGFINGTWYDIPVCGSGQNATAIVEVNSGSVTSVKISYNGSGYSSGETVTLKGIPHSSTNGASVTVTISAVFDSLQNGIQVIGCENLENDGFFPITSITNNTISYTNENGIEETNSGIALISDVKFNITNVSYSSEISTITTNYPHSLFVGSKVYFSAYPNQTFDVISVSSSTVFSVSSDVSSATYGFVVPLIPSLKDSNSVNENLSARQYQLIGKSFTRLNADVSKNTIGNGSDFITVSNSKGFLKSDFIQVDDEIMLITQYPNGSAIYVLRGLFNTKPSEHKANSVVKKVTPLAVELRRNSILRASGHTFEYVGFGPGNYSTGMPTNQNRVLTSDETLISQSLSTRGGVVLYTGMNSDGEFFVGRKKFNALTGEEELLGIPKAESQNNYFEDLVVNNLTVTNALDASTAEVSTKNINVVNNLTVGGNTKLGITTTGSLTVLSGATIEGITINNDLDVGNNLSVTGDIDGSLKYTVSGGDGLTGSFNNTSNQSINLGTPSGITSTSTNSTTDISHSHLLSPGAVTASKLSGQQSGPAAVYGIRLWGSFNDSSSISNSGSGNWTVSKFTQDGNSTGRYQITFTGSFSLDNYNQLNNGKYLVIATAIDDDNNGVNEYATITERTVSGFKVVTRNQDGRSDSAVNFAVIF